MTSMKPVLLTAAIAAVMGGYSNTSSAETRPSLSGLQTQINQLKNGTTPVAPLIGNSTAACNTTTQGLLRWNATDGQMELCDGTAWSAVMDEGHTTMSETFAMVCTLSKNAGIAEGSQPSYCRTAVDRYQVMGTNDEIIKDLVTGLEWQRCSVGYKWNNTNKTCDDDLAVANAYLYANAVTLTAAGNFRIPTIDELKTLVYCSSGKPVTIGMTADYTTCFGTYTQPTIVQWAFPNTPSYWFWSGSPDADYAGNAWYVYFKDGYASNGLNRFNGLNHVRLVRAFAR